MSAWHQHGIGAAPPGAPRDVVGAGGDAAQPPEAAWPGGVAHPGHVVRPTGAVPPAAPRPSWFARLSLRTRMALLVGVAVAAGVALVAGVALAATSIVLKNAIDDQLVQQAQASATNASWFQLGPDGIKITTTGFGLPFQVISDDGTVVRSQFPVPDLVELPVDAADVAVARQQSSQHLHTATIGGTEYRIATVPLHPVRPLPGVNLNLALQLARPMTDVQQTVRDLGLILLGVGVAGVVGSVLVGRLVSRAALKPVDAAAAAAEEVARTQDLSALIPVTGSDEIARLAASLNSMLRALEASRVRQRQLVDDASHELRTPLTSLRTNIELLMRAEANPDRALPAADRTALLRDVDAQMRELSGLVSELVELAREEAPIEEVEQFDLADVVQAAAERVRRRATAKGIRIDVTATTSMIDGRPSMLERAVTNLLDNAVKFAPPSSTVRVDTRAGEVTVIDEGPGIAPEDRPKVFQRFYRATAARSLPGSGLGLAIVADAAASHGGSVVAGQAPGGGALMRLRLPVAPAGRIGAPWPPPGRGLPPPGRGLPVPPGGSGPAGGTWSGGGRAGGATAGTDGAAAAGDPGDPGRPGDPDRHRPDAPPPPAAHSANSRDRWTGKGEDPDS